MSDAEPPRLPESEPDSAAEAIAVPEDGEPTAASHDPREFVLGAVRIGGAVSLNAASWGASKVLRAGVRFAHEATGLAGEGLGGAGGSMAGAGVIDATRGQQDLRQRAAALLAKSGDVSAPVGEHPAYAVLLAQLAPDEARILVFLAGAGEQPSVSVTAGALFGGARRLLLGRQTLLVMAAGVRERSRMAEYWDNLVRLGLVAFEDCEGEDSEGYQVLEVQPEVLAELGNARGAKAARGTVALTALGAAFAQSAWGPEQLSSTL